MASLLRTATGVAALAVLGAAASLGVFGPLTLTAQQERLEALLRGVATGEPSSAGLSLAAAAVLVLIGVLAQPLVAGAWAALIRLGRKRGLAGWTYGRVSAAFVRQLQAATAPDRVYWANGDSRAAAELKKCSRDMGFHTAARPDAVVSPRSAEEVAAVVALCAKHCVPVLARGAGSGLEGGAIPYQGGVVLNLMKMKDKELMADDLMVRVQPGVKKAELNEWLEPRGLLFGPDPASNPSVGGMASTRGSGLSTIMYGTTKENVVSLVVVTPAGKIVRTRQCVRKSATGYDLTQLYIGSEGTLGVIVELVLKVRPIPPVRCGAMAVFPDVASAAKAVCDATRSNLGTICRCELLNADGIRATNNKFKTALKDLPTVFLEFRATDEAACRAEADALKAISESHGASGFTFTKDAKEMDELWAARRGCYIASMSYRAEGQKDSVYLSDTCVPRGRLAELIGLTEEDFVSNGFPCIICAHIADANFHCCIPYQPAEKETIVALERRLISRAVEMGGTVSGEHGVGVGKMEHIIEEHGEDHIDIQRSIKRALDPSNIMNPAKMFITPADVGGSTAIPALYHRQDTDKERSYSW